MENVLKVILLSQQCLAMSLKLFLKNFTAEKTAFACDFIMVDRCQIFLIVVFKQNR